MILLILSFCTVKSYFAISQENGISPLSVLIFPEGGCLSLWPMSLETSQTKSLKNRKRFGQLSLSFGKKEKRMTFRNCKSKVRLIEFKPGSFIIFR
jgi:hypothetical protein